MCKLCNDTGVIRYPNGVLINGEDAEFCNCPLGIGLSECYPMPETECRVCHGSGIVNDWVDYGSTRVSMPSQCNCALGARLWALEEPKEAWEACQQ